MYWVVQAGLLTPLTFTQHRLCPLAAFTSVSTFFTVMTIKKGDSEFAKFTMAFKAFFKAHTHRQNVLGNKQYFFCLCYRMPQNASPPPPPPPPQTHDLVSQKNNAKMLFSILHHLSPVIFADATQVAFVQLHSSRLNFHCHTQRELTPTWKSSQMWQL